MRVEPEPPDDTTREADEAAVRFVAPASKHAAVLLFAPDCETRLDHLDALLEPRVFAARLRAARAHAIPWR